MLTFNEMKSYFQDRFYGNTKESLIRKVIQKAGNLVGEDNIEIFYPKNLFVEDRNFELYLFCCNNKILKISVEDDNFITTNLFNKDDIEKVILKENYKDDDEKVLEIKFKDNESFEFKSNDDTNENYRGRLANLIEQICKSITNDNKQ